MNIRIPITPELRVRLAHTDCLVVELPPEISTALEGREELMKSLTAADVPTDGEALRVERDLLSAKCDALSFQVNVAFADVFLLSKSLFEAVDVLEREFLPALEDKDPLEELIAEFRGALGKSPEAHLAAHDAEVAAKAVEDFWFSGASHITTDEAISYIAQLRAKAGK